MREGVVGGQYLVETCLTSVKNREIRYFGFGTLGEPLTSSDTRLEAPVKTPPPPLSLVQYVLQSKDGVLVVRRVTVGGRIWGSKRGLVETYKQGSIFFSSLRVHRENVEQGIFFFFFLDFVVLSLERTGDRKVQTVVLWCRRGRPCVNRGRFKIHFVVSVFLG